MCSSVSCCCPRRKITDPGIRMHSSSLLSSLSPHGPPAPCVLNNLSKLLLQRSPAGASGPIRSPYSGRGHGFAGYGAGGAQSNFVSGSGSQQQQHQQSGQQGHWPIPPRAPRSNDAGAGMGGNGDSVAWMGSSGGNGSGSGAGGDGGGWTNMSPLQQQHHRVGSGGRGTSGWDERGGGAPDVMRSIHEGNPSPES